MATETINNGEIFIYNLPDDFSNEEEKNSQVIIRRYSSPRNSEKNKSILHQNMVDIITHGKKTIIDAYNITSFEAGEMLVLSKGSYIISQAVPVNGLFNNIVIYFTNEFFTSFLIKYRSITEKAAIKKQESSPLLQYKQDVFMQAYVQSLQLMLNNPAAFSTEFKMVKAEELLLYLLQSDAAKLASLSVMTKNSDDMQLRKAAEANISTMVTTEELAFLCNTSLTSFKRKFKKLYSMPPQKWLVRQRMLLASKLLRDPAETSSSVYEKMGYENHSSFIKAFKLQFGVTPSQFKQQNLAL